MKMIKILRTARKLTLMDLQNLTGINAGTLSLFENSKLDLDEDQQARILKIFPQHDKKRLFADIETTHRSIFGPRKLSPQMEARIDAEVKKSLERMEGEIEKKRERHASAAKERVAGFNQRKF